MLVPMSVLVTGCAKRLPTIRYQMTVEVDTPEGLRSGSSVIEVESWDLGKGFPGPEAGGIRRNATGEAVAVDLPGGQQLFALLTSRVDPDAAANIIFAALPHRQSAYVGEDAVERMLEAINQNHRIMPIMARPPLLVRFRDITDPTTVEEVNPENLAATFGSDFALRNITIQVTDRPRESKIEKRLRWLSRQRGALMKGARTISRRELPLAERLGEGDFIRNW